MSEEWLPIYEIDADHGDSDFQVTLLNGSRPVYVRSSDPRAASVFALAFAWNLCVQVDLYQGERTLSVVRLGVERGGAITEFRYEVTTGRAWLRLADNREAWTAHAAQQAVIELAIALKARLSNELVIVEGSKEMLLTYVVILEATQELKRAMILPEGGPSRPRTAAPPWG